MVNAMACRYLGTKCLPQPGVTFCQLDWTWMNKLQWKSNETKYFSFKKMYSRMSLTILFWPQCVNSHGPSTGWRHQMETFSALLAICAGNSSVNSQHKGQWRRALMLSLICAWINSWVHNRKAGDFRRHPAQYDITVMMLSKAIGTIKNAC